MKTLAKLPALKYTALVIFCISLPTAVSACFGFIYSIINGFFKPEAAIPTDGFNLFCYNVRYVFGIVTVSCLSISVFLLIFLMLGAGEKRKKQGVFARDVERMPFEVYALIMFTLIAICIWSSLFVMSELAFWNLFVICPCLVVASFFFEEIFVSLSIRYKNGTLYKKSLLKQLVIRIKFIFRHLNVSWKILLVLLAYFVLTFFAFHFNRIALISVWIVATVLLLGIVSSCIVFWNKLKSAVSRIADGNFNHKIDTTGMTDEFKTFGKYINSISDGMTKAVNEKTKSDRLRTELITNVSHDIKTPLTSIINYVDILDRDGISEEEKKESLSVLKRQSKKLKKLIVDLVEASKAITGNIAVNAVPTNINELLLQATAEYTDKFAEAQITPILSIPETPITVLCDGGLTWRIFDNLLENIRKYSLRGTRIYISAENDGENCLITFKNISKSTLNKSADELTERFVRGDDSRSTEGSGLGLSIASSLAELQGGTLKITTDGDLFKVIVSFCTVLPKE